MFIYLYKITNTINGKIYVGIHKTKNKDDGYMGSGKIIRQAVEKYGIANFKKDVLEEFESYEKALEKEKELVNEDFLNDPNVYNIRRGGHGGFDFINKHRLGLTPEAMEKKIRSMSGPRPHLVGRKGTPHTEMAKAAMSKKILEQFANGRSHPKGMIGKTHSSSTRKKLSQQMKCKSSLIGKFGENHPSYGLKWFNNGIEDCRSKERPGEDWVQGRIFKSRVRRKK